MPEWPLMLRLAAEDDMAEIIGLIEDAADWLRTKNTDQWAQPWPSLAGRDSRILADIRRGKTWIAWDNDVAAATITANPEEDPHWPDDLRRDPAIYVHRLVVARRRKGVGLGAALLDWAGRTARRDHGARWIRVSAWTTNLGLHAYYRRQGFEGSGLHPDDGYPSRARFQKSTARLPASNAGLFRLARPPGGCSLSWRCRERRRRRRGRPPGRGRPRGPAGPG
jgi:GNAT superfamily N-acetyltransferase